MSEEFEPGQMVILARNVFLPGIPLGTQGKIVSRKKYPSGDIVYDVEFVIRKTVVMRAHEREIELEFEAIPPWTYTVSTEDLTLKVRTFNTLRRAGLYNMGEVLERFQRGDKEMLDIRNFGPKSLDELRGALAKRLRAGTDSE